MNYQNRADIPERYRWDLSSMYASDDEFLAALEQAQAYPAQCQEFSGAIAQSAERLLAFLKLDDAIGIDMGKLVNYANRKADEDTRVSTYQDYSDRVMQLYASIGAAQSWFASELLAIAPEQMEAFYQEPPELEGYRRALDRVFARREHTLSPAEERLLAAATEMATAPENIFSLLNNADMAFDDALDATGETHAVTHGSYIPLMMSPDRTLRESAFRSLYKTYGQFRNTCAATLSAQLKQQKFYADARKYPDTLAAALDATEVPVAVYENLIKTVREKLPALHRYIDLRKRVLALDELHFWDLYVPIVEDVEFEYTYEEACELMLEALAPLGEDYLELVRTGLRERWVDVFETPGKRSGAYSAGSYGTHPVMLLNFQGKLDDVFTLVHEMGHSIHSYLSSHEQPPAYSHYVIFVAEVASTCNEALLTQHLLKVTADPAKRAYILNHFLEQFRGTIYRQCMFAEFELETNRMAAKGLGTTPDALSELYGQLNADYYGAGIALDEEITLEWARIPHFYYHYYVYQYATGFSAAIALAERILHEGGQAVADYLGFLSGGSSKTPIELLRGAGVDMESPEPIAAALDLFGQLVDELAEALGARNNPADEAQE